MNPAPPATSWCIRAGRISRWNSRPTPARWIGRGVMKRLCVPNSWVGDYQKYFRPMEAAQEFFAASFGEPAPKALTRQLRC